MYGKNKTEGERVEKEELYLDIIQKAENDLIKKIEELDIKIDEALQKENTVYPSDIKILEIK